MRHDVAGEGDVAELVEGDGLDEEGDVGLAAFDQAYGLVGFADVADVAKPGDGLLVEAEEAIENDAVELDHVELGLPRGDFCQGLLDGFGFGGEEVGAILGDGEEGYAVGGNELFQIGFDQLSESFLSCPNP